MGPDSPVQVDGVLTAVDYLRAGGREVGYPDSATIIRRGDPGKDFFVLLSGRLDVILPGADGQQLPLAHLEPGASFGEMSILTGSAVSADIVARGPVRLLVYPGERLRTALAESTAVREHVLGSLISGLRRADLDMWNTSQHMRALSGLAGKSVRTGPLIMVSPLMQALQKRIGELSARILPILVAGDLGVGKLFIARKIHEAGCGSGGEGLGSSAAPFIVVDCLRLGVGEAARLIFGSATAGFVLPGESDFAGPEGKAKPASTGSESLPLLGAIHLAAGGTLVLQHIEALEGSAQEILCRYLDAQAARDTYPHTRVIGTTRRDPAVLAEAADVFPALREHFAKRTVGVPRLRDRKRDILPLARMFLEEDNQRLHGRDRRFALSAERALVSNQYRHHNVTELREAVEFAAVFADTPEILQEHIFTGPRDQGTGPEYDLAQLPVVMRLTRGRGLSVVRAGVLLLFAAIAVLCLFAGRSASGRVANALVWGLWWPSLMLLFLFVGRVWCALCPVAAAGRLFRRLKSLNLAAPAWVRKHTGWLMSLLLVLILWSEHVFHMPTWPRATGFLLLSLIAAAAIFCVLFDREVWCRYLCPLGGLAANYAVPAPLHVRANPNICGAQCTTHACFKGAEGNPGCPVFHHPLYAKDAHFCKLCLACLRNCPNGSARLYLRPPLWGIWGLADLSPVLCPLGLVAFFLSMVMLGARGGVWTATPLGFSAMTALAVGCAVALHALLPRLLSPDGDPDPALVARVCFALMVLGWGPLMSFHLENVPGLAGLRIEAIPSSFWNTGLHVARFSLLAMIQLSVIAFAAVIAAITFWRIRAAFVQTRGNRSPRGWRLLVSLAVIYYLTASVLTVYHGFGW